MFRKKFDPEVLKPLPREPNGSEPPKPEDRMRGVCASCRRVLFCRRDESVRQQPDDWLDAPHCECPDCGAKVYLLPAPPEPLFYQI